VLLVVDVELESEEELESEDPDLSEDPAFSEAAVAFVAFDALRLSVL
jgi:hypothetical protein